MDKKHSMGIMGRAIRYLGIKKMSLKEIERDRALYNKLNTDTRFSTGRKHDCICRADKYAPNGQVGGDYFIQDIWGARKVFDAAPAVHYDVGSRVAGFIAHLLSMKQKIVLIDVRQMNNDFDTPFLREPRASAISGQSGGGGTDSPAGVDYICADATNLEGIEAGSVESLSALCSLEHFGLGRYGDAINPAGWESALKAFQRVLKAGGKLYLSVPVGQVSKVCFNGCRVFRPELIIGALNEMRLLEFGYIDGFDVKNVMKYEGGELRVDKAALDAIPEIINWGATGLFEFEKL